MHAFAGLSPPLRLSSKNENDVYENIHQERKCVCEDERRREHNSRNNDRGKRDKG